jgi:crotonobetainyl-CoA:carnitine CoA-transferase CaiB-like acyl-CoA transferase
VPSSTRANPANRVYRCSSGRIEIAVQTEEQWHALAVCLGRPELAYEGAWEAVRTSPPDGAVALVLEEMFAEDPASLWSRRLEAQGVPCEVESGRADARHPTPDLH